MKTGFVALFLTTIFGVWNGFKWSAKASSQQHAGLKIETLRSPDVCHRFAQVGDMITVHYNGTLENGTVFDSSHKRGHPLNFQLGNAEVISGWDKGLVGMCTGEIRKLTVPPELGYGSKATGTIPEDATLIFEIELIDVKEGAKPPNVFKEVDADGNKKLTKEEIAAYFHRNMNDTVLSPALLAEMVKNVFLQEDKNRDGVITSLEFFSPRGSTHAEL